MSNYTPTGKQRYLQHSYNSLRIYTIAWTFRTFCAYLYLMKQSVPVFNIENFNDFALQHTIHCDILSSHLKKYPGLIIPDKPYYFITILFTQGLGIHEIDFTTHRISRGHISFVAPGQVHSWKFTKDIEGIIFLHSKDFYDLNFTHKRVSHFPFFCSIYNTACVKVAQRDLNYFKSLFDLVVSEFHLNTLMSLSKICSLIDIIYTDATRIYNPQEEHWEQNGPYLKKFIRLEELISKKYKTIKSPGEYAKLMHISERHLNRICKSTVKQSVGDVIHERIILEAKRLLASGDVAVSEVAVKLGYDDPAYFSRLFKIKTGFSASEFMKRYRKSFGIRYR
jgi:AraC-like DNA-binding protein